MHVKSLSRQRNAYVLGYARVPDKLCQLPRTNTSGRETHSVKCSAEGTNARIVLLNWFFRMIRTN